MNKGKIIRTMVNQYTHRHRENDCYYKDDDTECQFETVNSTQIKL